MLLFGKRRQEAKKNPARTKFQTRNLWNLNIDLCHLSHPPLSITMLLFSGMDDKKKESTAERIETQ